MWYFLALRDSFLVGTDWLHHVLWLNRTALELILVGLVLLIFIGLNNASGGDLGFFAFLVGLGILLCTAVPVILFWLVHPLLPLSWQTGYALSLTCIIWVAIVLAGEKLCELTKPLYKYRR